MKSPHLEADPDLTVDRSAHTADANQTWPDARGETTDPGSPPHLDPSTGLGRDEDGGRTQPDLIGPGGKLVGFGGLRPDVKVQAESAGRSAARYEASAAPARSVLPMEEDTSRRIVVNQTQPMGLPIVRNEPAPGLVTAPIAATNGDDAVPPNSTHADGNETVRRARQPKARIWLATAVGVGIAILIALSIVFVFASPPSATTTAEAPKSSAPVLNLPPPLASAASPAEVISSAPTAGSAPLPLATSVPPAATPPNGSAETGAASAARAPRLPKAVASAVPAAAARPSAVAPPSPVLPIEPKQAPSSGDILRSQ